ncbi:hypothetical protein BpHYR1_007084 [Brachionus plicatilis]|uniref:Uncharacterized protein n=1 Tax=Brachionus plicatilis TaxID=10195 RepID=A0A3M7PL50_BRAPC|nr:hypothetical protein BpHYR1_007084 [Brachionus plicatilis]
MVKIGLKIHKAPIMFNSAIINPFSYKITIKFWDYELYLVVFGILIINNTRKKFETRIEFIA